MRVNAVWIGKEFPMVQRLSARSWLAHGHEYHLWVYDHVVGVPDGVIVRDGTDILEGPIHRYTDPKHKDSPVLHANLFRYAFLAKRGGAFVDADTVCLAEFDLTGEWAFSSEVVAKKPHPNFAFVCVPERETAFARDCYGEAQSRLHTKTWGLFGPALLNQQIANHDMGAYVLAPEVFCKIGYWEISRFFDPDPPDMEGCLGSHMWQQILSRNGIDLILDRPKTSLWQRWREAYL